MPDDQVCVGSKDEADEETRRRIEDMPDGHALMFRGQQRSDGSWVVTYRLYRQDETVPISSDWTVRRKA